MCKSQKSLHSGTAVSNFHTYFFFFFIFILNFISHDDACRPQILVLNVYISANSMFERSIMNINPKLEHLSMKIEKMWHISRHTYFVYSHVRYDIVINNIKMLYHSMSFVIL